MHGDRGRRPSDTVEFTRRGVKGQLMVAADHFELDAQAGLPARRVQQDASRRDREELDALLASGQAAGREEGAARRSGKK
jgi:hypothetical protein